MNAIIVVVIAVVALAGVFGFGVLFGRKNQKKVEATVAEVKKVSAVVVDTAKKL